MAPLDMDETAPERQQLKSSQENEDSQPVRTWFQRIFQPEPVLITPTLHDPTPQDQEQSEALLRDDAFDFDLPLPVETAPVAQPALEESELLPQTVSAEQVDAGNELVAPVTEIMIDPLAPQATASDESPSSSPGTVAAQSTSIQSERDRSLLPEQHSETNREPESNSFSEPVAAIEPEPEAQPVAWQTAAAQAKPVSAIDESNPNPSKRWDPIPPLRPQEEPWRSSSSSRVAQQTTRGIWGDDQPIQLAPTERWSTPEHVALDAVLSAESPEIVLTRRWGLLSRFQQGESFQASRNFPLHEAELPVELPPQDSSRQDGEDHEPDQNPNYDPRRH